MKATTARAWLAHAGSLRATLAAMALFALVVLGGAVSDGPWTFAIGGAVALLSANLLAAIVVHPAFRAQFALLVAHLALLALVLLAALGRLVSVDGRFELAQDQVFDGTLLDARIGAWARADLAPLALRHEGFTIDYAAGRRRGPTRNTVAWRDADGRTQRAVIGDHRALVVDGWRLYTSPNKGFAPVLTWTPDGGAPVTGAVHLPAFPAHELRQWREWTPPGATVPVWVQLRFDEALIDPAGPAAFRLPERHRLVVVAGSVEAELEPGASVALPGGTLRHDGLRTWMGYRVHRDPTLPWLLAAALLAAGALAWHYTVRFFGAPARARVAGAATAPLAEVRHG